MRPKTRVLLLALTVAAAGASGATDELSPDTSAEAAPIQADSAAVQELMREMQNLRARVQSLEAKLAEANAARPPIEKAAVVSSASLAHPDMTGMAEPQSDDPHSQHSFLNSPLLNVRGYADLGYRAVTSSGGTNSFRLGEADVFLTSKLSDKLSFLMETVLGSDRNNAQGIDVERIFLTYRHNEYLNIDVGRYHSALGYFNAAFHHGRWFQTAADRPFLFWFEDDGGILPIHNVGVSVSGRLPSGSLNLHYVAEAGNGRAYRNPGVEPVQGNSDENNGKSLNVALYAEPHSLPGWQFGASVYRDRLTPEGASKVDQRIYTAHAVYLRDRIEFLNEGVVMRHRTLTGADRVTTVPGFYSQLAYRVTPSGRPYFRFEYANSAASDPVVSPILGSAGYRRSFTGGYRFDIAEYCALKFQIERVSRRDLRPATEGAAQLSFAF